MTVLVDEIGALAAENVTTILSNAGEGAWDRLAEGGWTALGADPQAQLSLRDLQEIARVTGRYPVATPLVTTLLAGRWFGSAPRDLAAGVGLALPRGEELVVPYATDTMVVLDAAGRPLPADAVRGGREDFALAMPLATVKAPRDPVRWAPQHRAELHAALAAVAVGCADAVLDQAVAWAQTRTQFGQPIRQFQAVRHHLANMHIAREQGWTAAIASAHEPDRAGSWSRQVCAQSVTAIELGIQVHGGVGFTWEVGLHHFLNHVLQIQSLLGATP